MADAEFSALPPSLSPGAARAVRTRVSELIREATQIEQPLEASRTPGAEEPFWELAPTPWVMSAEEWAALSAGLVQRARLTNAFLQDIYAGQTVLHERILPPEIILGNANYRRPCLNLEPQRANPATLLRFDLMKRGAAWTVVGTQANTAVGLGYAVQNRRFLTQEAAQLYKGLPDYHGSSSFPLELLDALRALSPRPADEPSIVVLTAGLEDPFYAEHSFLARKMGVPLVRGDDLLVLDNCVYLKTIAGLNRVDVIYRRVGDGHIDPVVFTTARHGAGVPGLLQCVRQGAVVIANAVGSGLAENRALDAFLPKLCRHYLSENLRLAPLETFLCDDREALEAQLGRLGQLRLRKAQPNAFAHSGEDDPFDEVTLTPGAPLPDAVRRAPHRYVVQELPGYAESTTSISVYVLATGTQYRVLPGGLVHLAAGEPSATRLGLTTDLVVLQGSTPNPPAPAASMVASGAPQRALLGSRSAENLYWIGRYLERAESTARMLSIFDDVALEELPARDRRKWLPIWNGLLEAAGQMPTGSPTRSASSVGISPDLAWQMSLDPTHPNSIYSSIEMARDNARQLRDCLSPEAWSVLNQLHEDLHEMLAHSAMASDPLSSKERLSRSALERAMLGINGFLGTAERTLLQDATWQFVRIGLHLERAIMTCSALRHILTVIEKEPVGAAIGHDRDRPELSVLVRMLGSQDAYRRLYHTGSVPSLVADLLLQQPHAPRSIRHNLDAMAEAVEHIRHELGGAAALHSLDTQARLMEMREFVGRLRLATTPSPGPKNAAERLGAQLPAVLQQLYMFHTHLSDLYFSHQARVSQVLTA